MSETTCIHHHEGLLTLEEVRFWFIDLIFKCITFGVKESL